MASSEREFPCAVLYCPNCSLPPEYCRYTPRFEKCKPWLKDNCPELYPDLFASAPSATVASSTDIDVPSSGAGSAVAVPDIGSLSIGGAAGAASSSTAPAAAASDVAEAKKHQTRGGQVKGGGAGKKKAEAQAIIISVKDRGRRKFVTTVSGLDAFDIKLKDAASQLGKKFGSGASVTKNATGGQEIDIQGDLTADLPDVIVALFGVPESAIIVRD